VPTAPGFGASCSWNASSGPRPTADGAAATSTADEPDPPAHRHCMLRRPPPQLGVGSVGGPPPKNQQAMPWGRADRYADPNDDTAVGNRVSKSKTTTCSGRTAMRPILMAGGNDPT
jgi:hypothetical protein